MGDLGEIPIVRKGYARIGLIGNPSDGFFGKTIALSISNYYAEVTLTKSETIRVLPNPKHDQTERKDLEEFYKVCKTNGYNGGLRLLQATLVTFFEHCQKNSIKLHDDKFTLAYETSIPRQVGLAGSSAIITACLKCLIRFYDLTEKQITREFLPTIVLDVEKRELGSNAGLQDRVVQVYGGLVYMDFNKETMETKGHGDYKDLDTEMENLPPMWLAYTAEPSDSSKIHQNVHERFEKADLAVLDNIEQFKKLTEDAKTAIVDKKWDDLGKLMSTNLKCREKMYTLGEATKKMIKIAKSFGSCVKLPGSGGAVIGLVLDDKIKMDEMKKSYTDAGFTFAYITPRQKESYPDLS